MSRARTFSTPAIVLSYKKIGERDLIVVLLSRQQGKIRMIAKGARKLTSSKKAALEPGNVVTAYGVITKSMPLLTQAKLLEDCMPIRSSLQKIRQLSQLLEIFDRLFVNEELEPEMFQHILKMRKLIVTDQPTKSTILTKIDHLLTMLGYQPLADTKHQSVMDYVADITERPMKSWEFFKV
jgi:DNA repair protein RecO (recombination protein O)